MAFACCCMIDSKYTLYTDVTTFESVQGNKTSKNEKSKQIRNIRVAQRFALSPNMKMIVASIPTLLNEDSTVVEFACVASLQVLQVPPTDSETCTSG